MNPETALQRQILRTVSRGRWRFFSNPRGVAVCVAPGTVTAAVAILARHGIHATVRSFGVGPNGAADLLGIESVTVMPEHVGRTVALAHIAEIKTRTGRVRGEQTMFMRAAQRFGCGVHLWRSVEQAQEETR